MFGIHGEIEHWSTAQPLREFAILRKALANDVELSAFERVLRNALASTLHGVGVVLDGGTHFSDLHELRLTADGEELEPGLHERVISYLDETGRAPIPS